MSIIQDEHWCLYVYMFVSFAYSVCSYIMIKDRPCKVVNVSTSKTGKHGHAKANFTAIDIFNGKKVEDVIPTTHTTYVPNVMRSEYQLLDIEDGFCSLLKEDGDTRDDLKLPDYPEGFGQEIQNAFNDGKTLIVTVLSAVGTDQIVSYKEENSSA